MRELGYVGTLVSLEPVAAPFAKLKTAAGGDPNWITLNCAAGVANETKSINVMSASVFSSFNTPSRANTSRFADQNAVVATESVQVRRLDGVIDELGCSGKLKNCLLKSDTQGFDRNVLEGLGSYLNEISRSSTGAKRRSDVRKHHWNDGYAFISPRPVFCSRRAVSDQLVGGLECDRTRLSRGQSEVRQRGCGIGKG